VALCIVGKKEIPSLSPKTELEIARGREKDRILREEKEIQRQA
jgi:hypothetical protein